MGFTKRREVVSTNAFLSFGEYFYLLALEMSQEKFPVVFTLMLKQIIRWVCGYKKRFSFWLSLIFFDLGTGVLLISRASSFYFVVF